MIGPPVVGDVRELVRRVAAETLRHGLEEDFAAGRTNPEALPALAEAGLLGLTMPPVYGGMGRDYRALAAACEELGKVDLAFQISVTVHLALTAMTMLQWGTAEQCDAWLPALARGERIATFGLTEPDAGSDVAALRMRATPERGGYRLDGEKTWISGAGEASLFLLFATVDPAARHKGLIALLVPRGTAGLSTAPLPGKLGVRAGDTGVVVCDGAWAPAANRLGEPGEGFAIALSALGNGLFTVGAGALGVAAACRELTIGLVRETDAAGGDLGRRQTTLAALARMTAGEERARALLERAAELKNRGEPSAAATSLAKWTAAEVAHEAAEAALALHQAVASPATPTVERHLRNVRGSVIYGGTREIHQVMQADYALGVRAERPFRRPAPTAAELAGGERVGAGLRGDRGLPR